MAHSGISQLVMARTGPTAISLPATIGCTAFSHIFLLSLPKLGNVEHEQKKKKLSNLPMTKLGTNGPDSGRLKIRSPEIIRNPMA